MWLHLLLSKIAEALQTLAGEEGTVSLCSSPEEALELLAVGPGRYRIVLHWSGDTVDSGQPGLVETRINVIVQQGAGLQATAGKDMVASVSGRPPFYERLEQVRMWLRSLHYPPPANGPEMVCCKGGYCGDARPLILQDKDGRVIPGLRQAEFDYVITRVLPWATKIPVQVYEPA